MKPYYRKEWLYSLVFGLTLMSGACRQEEPIVDKRSIRSVSQDARPGNPNILFYLPAPDSIITDAETLGSPLDIYYLRVDALGDDCEDGGTVLEQSGPYPNNSEEPIALPSKDGCDYEVEFLLGSTAEPLDPDATSETITYESPIAKSLNDHCLSCHPGYNSYEAVMLVKDEIVFQVENSLMPPDGGLPDVSIAAYLAWQANGFLESDPNKPEPDSLRATVRQVFYRNNRNSTVYNYQLLGRRYLVYEESLWLQEIGYQAGYRSTELEIREPQDDLQD